MIELQNLIGSNDEDSSKAHRLIFAQENFSPSVDSSEKTQQAQKAPKPLSQQSPLELKFTAQELFNMLDNADSSIEAKRKAIAQLKEVAKKFQKDPRGVFLINQYQAKEWFKANNLLPTDLDRIEMILTGQENKISKLANQSVLKDAQLLRAVAGERYQNMAKQFVEYHSKTVVDSIKTAAAAFRRHQKMRDKIKSDPEIHAYFKKKIDAYNQKAAKPHWSDQYAILKECYEMAIGKIPRPQKPKQKEKPQNKETQNLSDKAKSLFSSLQKFDKFAQNIKPPMLRNSVEGRWVNISSITKVAQKWLTNPSSLNQNETSYLERALNTSENTRAITLLTFNQVAFKLSDPSIKPIIASRINKLKDQFFSSIKDAISQKLNKEEASTLYQNFQNIQVLTNVLSTDGEGLATKALEGRGNPSKKQLEAIFKLFNLIPAAKEHLYSNLSTHEKKSATSVQGDLASIYIKIIKKFEKDSSSSMPPLLALIKDHAIFISHISVASATLRNLASEADFFSKTNQIS